MSKNTLPFPPTWENCHECFFGQVGNKKVIQSGLQFRYILIFFVGFIYKMRSSPRHKRGTSRHRRILARNQRRSSRKNGNSKRRVNTSHGRYRSVSSSEQRALEETFILSARVGDIRRMQRCIDEGLINLNVQDTNDATPLVYAVNNGRFRMVEFLLQYQTVIDNIDKECHNELTAHMLAALRFPGIAHILREKGADINYITTNGTYALMLAVERNDSNVLHALLEAGANVNIRVLPNGPTPLMYQAVRLNNEDEITKQLLIFEADVNLRDEQGRTALHIAVEFDNVRCANRLLDHVSEALKQEVRNSFPNQWDALQLLQGRPESPFPNEEDAVQLLEGRPESPSL